MAQIFSVQNYIPFFHQLLTTPAGSLPKGAQWIVAFEDLETNILPSIKLAASLERKPWAVESASNIVTSETYQKNAGCYFCQAISLPGDGTTAVAEGNIKSNAFIRSYVGVGREDFPIMRMSFLDTNVSFADNFLRSWALATANFGLIARAKKDQKNYRTNMTCYKLGQFDSKTPPVITMQITFYDICCIAVSEEENNYAPLAGSPTLREARFIYNYYEINSDKDTTFHKGLDTSNFQKALTEAKDIEKTYISDFEAISKVLNSPVPEPEPPKIAEVDKKILEMQQSLLEQQIKIQKELLEDRRTATEELEISIQTLARQEKEIENSNTLNKLVNEQIQQLKT